MTSDLRKKLKRAKSEIKTLKKKIATMNERLQATTGATEPTPPKFFELDHVQDFAGNHVGMPETKLEDGECSSIYQKTAGLELFQVKNEQNSLPTPVQWMPTKAIFIPAFKKENFKLARGENGNTAQNGELFFKNLEGVLENEKTNKEPKAESKNEQDFTARTESESSDNSESEGDFAEDEEELDENSVISENQLEVESENVQDFYERLFQSKNEQNSLPTPVQWMPTKAIFIPAFKKENFELARDENRNTAQNGELFFNNLGGNLKNEETNTEPKAESENEQDCTPRTESESSDNSDSEDNFAEDEEESDENSVTSENQLEVESENVQDFVGNHVPQTAMEHGECLWRCQKTTKFELIQVKNEQTFAQWTTTKDICFIPPFTEENLKSARGENQSTSQDGKLFFEKLDVVSKNEGRNTE